MSEDNDWTTVDTSGTVKAEEEKVEFEIEGEEEQQQEEAVVAQPEVETKQEVVKEEQDQKPEQEEQQSGAQKRIRQLVRQKKEREEKIAELVARQKELEEQLKAKQQEVETSVEKSFESAEQNVNNRIEMARDAYRQALESGDTDRIVKAQEHLSAAQNDAAMLKMNKQQFVQQRPEVQQPEQAVQQAEQPVQYDRLAVEWAGRNPWFGQDSVMTTLALEIDNELKGEGYDPSDEDFYQEIDSRLRSKFPERFNSGTAEQEQRQQETSSPAQVVGGASRTSTATSGSKKVKLSKEDIRLAEKWGIPLEQYAAEKLKVERAEGEYTSVYGN